MSIGLDIGSSAIRAAEIQVLKDGRKVLRHYGQVGIPAGYVVDGEIRNHVGVSAAVRRLWSEGGFTSNRVVVGISGPRVFVRQAEVPAMSVDDLRSSLRFDGQELIPIQMDDAGFDFGFLGGATEGPDGKSMQRILLVAAHKDLLRTYMSTLQAAGLRPTVMDASQLALMRAVPHLPAPGDGPQGVEIIVSIGAELTTVGVREDGVPRFIRSLSVGGAKLTESIANQLHIDPAIAERLKRGMVATDAPQVTQARKAVSAELRNLGEEVRATIDFFLSQSGGADVDRLLVTGGAAQMEGLAVAIAGKLPAHVSRLDPLAQLDTSGLHYDHDRLARMSATSATAVGLALWPFEAPLIRLSVLPDEILKARRAARRVALAGTGLGALVVVLGLAGAHEILSVHSEQHKVQQAKAQAATLQGDVTRLTAATSVHGQVLSRQGLVTSALTGDVDWTRLIGQLATVMPPSLSLTSFSGARTQTTTTSGSAASSSTTPGIGTLSLSVTGSGGLPAASAWLQGLQADPDLVGAWVSGVSVKQNGGSVTFSSNAYMSAVSESHREKEVGK